ncbi:MAG: hypothetical protein NTZ05_20240 [Chloroflexi bacterium]|nr:hypothetical protein [Chloroflexota bacterium]
MTTMRDLRETWDSVEARAGNLNAIIQEAGQRLGRRSPNPAYTRRLAQAATLIRDVQEGRTDPFYLKEAMSTSDFPLLMGDILDRQLLARYQEWEPTWQNYCKRGTVRDFRLVRRIRTDGLEGSYYPSYAQPEQVAPLEDDGLSETGYTYQVAVYSKATAIDWRMLINDDLDAFSEIPARLARGARRTEERFATTLFVDSSGPHASLYTSGNANIINTANGAASTNPALSIQGLQDGLTVLGNMRDAGGDPIVIESVELVVPPSLRVIAENILHAVQLWVGGSGQTGGGGVAAQQLITQNWMSSKMRLSVNPYIPIIASGANGNTSWFLFANPLVGRPAIEIGFLRGYETPSIFMKAPNTVRLGGAPAPEMGDFDTGEIRYKGMHVIGGTRLDGHATAASNGSGS